MAFFSHWIEPFDYAWRLCVAYVVLLGLVLLNVMAISYPFTGAVKVPFLLMALYFWSIFRPDFLPVWMTFLLGILLDSLTGLPLGLSALVFVLGRWFIVDQRRFFLAHSFVVIWLGFGLFCLCAGGAQWLIYGLMSADFSSLKTLVFSCALSTAFFPAVCLILHGCHKLLPMAGPVFSLKGEL